MERHLIQWTAPSPLWPELAKPGNGSGRAEFGVPAILRFASDDFMQDFSSTLATDPRKLGEFRAVPETWRGKLSQPVIPTPQKLFALQMQRLGSRLRRAPDAGAKATPSSDVKELPLLKLYQPAHMRYYLITACLTCRMPGLPDRQVDAGKQERVSFVIRRLFRPTAAAPGKNPDDPKNWDEYAWVKTPAGYAWQSARDEKQTKDEIVVEGEERLPLFPASFQEDDQRNRRLLAGLIPVGKREAYLSAQKASASPDATPAEKALLSATTRITARKILLRKQVIEPWKALVRQVKTAGTANTEQVTGDAIPDSGNRAAVRSAREQAQVISWLILSDFSEFLSLHIPELWQSVISGTRPGSAQPNIAAAHDALAQTTKSTTLAGALQSDYNTNSGAFQSLGYGSPPATLRDALANFGQGTDALNIALRKKLDAADQPYSRKAQDDRSVWPDFLFPLADPADDALQRPALNLGTLKVDEAKELSLDANSGPADPLVWLDKLAVLLVRAMAESKLNSAAPEPEIPTAAIVPEDTATAFFRIRCVYERPACGPLHDDVVSDSTEPFELAGFFDPDAPARPIRIGLPIDTTPAGLRKFDKNTAFIMSDILCGQVQKLKGLTLGDLVRSVLPWPLHKDLSVGDMKPCSTGSLGGNFGMICSLSIPIITICALILLMIMVKLLDLIFHWMPFFIICFPLPGFKGKKS